MSRLRRERVHIPERDASPRVTSSQSAVIVGGGLGGIAAATVLAERGVSVTLVEREPFLGGRVASWKESLASGESFHMERGFHAFFRQYYNVRALLRRIDPSLAMLRPLDDYPILAPGGQESFTRVPKQPPFNLLGMVARTRTLRFRDFPAINSNAALAMLGYDQAKTYERFDAMTATEYLDSLRFPPRARQLFFDVFAHSFFNPESAMSAGELLMMFHFYFLGNPEGLVFDVLREPFGTAVWEPMRRYLEGLGVRFLMERSVRRVTPRDGGTARRFAVELEGDGASPLEADAVVLATHVPALREIIAASPGLGDAGWRASIAGLDTTLPFAVWRLWLDRPCAPERMPFIGTTGYGILDNISVYNLFEGESARWAERSGGSVVELHAYAVPKERGEADIKRELLQGLHTLYPETREAKVLEERYLWREDCPSFAPGSFARRPTPEAPMPGLALAGDFVRLPFPTALMERATSSGFLAANHLLRDWRVRGEEVWSVPTQGLLAPW